MPDVKCLETFACQWGLFHGGAELPDDHPAVQEFPQFFDPVEPVKRGPGRPPGSKNKPKPTGDEPGGD